jgi:8-oxo-dGTP pyrophosphatase MutT (NUDIX family)
MSDGHDLVGGFTHATPNPWQRRSRRTAYENEWLTVWHDEVVRPDSTEGVYGVVHFPTTAVCIAATDGDRVLLVGQHRYPLDGAWTWELPAGGVPAGEETLDGAKRELEEEGGYTANQWRELSRFVLLDGASDLRGVIYEASDLTAGTASDSDFETLAVRWVRLEQALTLVDDGVIADAMSQIALLRIAVDRGIERPR